MKSIGRLARFNRLAHFFYSHGVFGPNEWNEANFDGDDDIDITDFNFVAANFSDTGYGTSAVPEPSAALLATLGIILLTVWCGLDPARIAAG